jgi:hypothetical protein
MSHTLKKDNRQSKIELLYGINEINVKFSSVLDKSVLHTHPPTILLVNRMREKMTLSHKHPRPKLRPLVKRLPRKLPLIRTMLKALLPPTTSRGKSSGNQ